MLWAGPIEFSAIDILFILIWAVLFALALPMMAGVVAVLVYRRKTPEADRSRRAAWILFFKVTALALLAQVLAGAVIGVIQELIG